MDQIINEFFWNEIMVPKKCTTLNWKNDFGGIMGNYVVLGSQFI